MQREVRVPLGRLKRLSRLARMGTQAGAKLLFSDDDTLAAKRVAEAFGSLRGLATKLGQMASYIDGFVPEAHEAAFEDALRELRAMAPTSPAPLIRELVEAELGAGMGELFATWEDEPFASASIGQVHRATLHDGRSAAVKVQHPGIERAIEDDLANGGLLARWVGALAPPAVQADRLFAEIARHFREELDYRREAAWQDRFARLHAADPRIIVPAVVGERSSTRVLSSELMHGESLEHAMRLPEAERGRYAQVLWSFVYRSILEHGIFNADPHPGNYLFRPEGIVFLDFGCIQELSPEVQQGSRLAHAAALARDEALFARHAAAIVEARGGPYETAFVAYLRQTLEPIFRSPYRITRGYVRELFQALLDLKRCAFSRQSGLVPLPESTVLLNRLHFGFFSVLARLDVEVDYAAIERQFL